MENKYLVTIEFRYCDIKNYDDEPSYISKTVTIGIYDCYNEACNYGNNILEVMENKFELHKFPDGRVAFKERLNKKNNLITNLAYLKTSFQFYLKITELKYDEINKTINEVLESVKRYNTYKETL